MDVVLGLDISTTTIGWAVIPDTTFDLISRQHPILKGHVDLSKNKGGFWSKVDQMEKAFTNVIFPMIVTHDEGSLRVTKLFVEDPVERFKNGMSSAHTIALLAKFNALTSMHVRRLLSIDPLYIGATVARKAIGVPLQQKKKCGKDHKVQTWEYLCTTVFINEEWPKNRNGKILDYVFDETDAFVICLAGVAGLGNPS